MDFLRSVVGDGDGFLRSLLSGVLAYSALVLLLRLSGKRTVAKWNAFDLIVTVALGSTLASAIVSGTVPVNQGIAAFLVLVGLQFLITSAAIRSRFVRRLIKSSPALLVYEGRFKEDAMKRERVTEDEVLSAARQKGFGDLREVKAVILETDGTFSVLGSISEDVDYSTLRDVEH